MGRCRIREGDDVRICFADFFMLGEFFARSVVILQLDRFVLWTELQSYFMVAGAGELFEARVLFQFC